MISYQADSRLKAAASLASQQWGHDSTTALVLRAYAEGRFFDRDAIDWKWIEEILVEFAGDWYDAAIREGQIYDFGRVLSAFGEAIGDTR